MAQEPPSQRRFWIIAAVVFAVTFAGLYWKGYPMVLIPEASAAAALVVTGLLHRVLFDKPRA
jgi:hypothetical protein